MTFKFTAFDDLLVLLAAIEENDPSVHDELGKEYYALRNMFVYRLVGEAAKRGYVVGFAPDEDPAWVIVYIELPTGQVSWHLPAYAGTWDGHDNAAKYARCRAMIER